MARAALTALKGAMVMTPWADDTLIGGAGNDMLFGNAQTDTLDGGAGDDTLDGWTGDDQINGGDGDDVLIGYYGDDEIDGGAGNDTIFTGRQAEFGGNSGADTINGGDGDDVFVVDQSNDGHVLTGGDGDDSYIFRYAQDDNATITDFDPATETLTFQVLLPQAVIDLGPVTYALVDNGAGGSSVVLTMPDGATVSPVVLEGVPPTAAIDLTVQVSA